MLPMLSDNRGRTQPAGSARFDNCREVPALDKVKRTCLQSPLPQSAAWGGCPGGQVRMWTNFDACRVWNRAAGACVLGTAAAVIVAAPAYAASFDFSFGPSATPHQGFGHIQGTLDYRAARNFDYEAFLEDVCPADGVGVSFFFDVAFMDDTEDNTNIKGVDANGCGNGYEYFVGNVSRAKNIKRTRVVTCWTNDGDNCWQIPINGFGAFKDNPYTG